MTQLITEIQNVYGLYKWGQFVTFEGPTQHPIPEVEGRDWPLISIEYRGREWVFRGTLKLALFQRYLIWPARNSAVGCGSALQAGRLQVWFQTGPGDDSTSKKTSYTGAPRCIGLKSLPLSCAGSDSLNLLELLELREACIRLPLPLHDYLISVV